MSPTPFGCRGEVVVIDRPGALCYTADQFLQTFPTARHRAGWRSGALRR